jgi:hypothetical protein
MPAVLKIVDPVTGLWIDAFGAPGPGVGPSRDDLIYGTYKPQGGVTAGLVDPNATFTTQGTGANTITLSTANAVYENVIFNGIVSIAALGIVFKNCVFKGLNNVTNSTGSSTPCVKGASASPTLGMLGGARFIDCLLDPQSKSWWSYTIQNSWVTLERCEIRGSVDGLSLGSPSTSDQPTQIYGCHIHDGTYYSWTAPATGDGHSDGQTHNDGIQIASGKNIHIKGNYIGGAPSTTGNINDGDDFHNSCIIIGQGTSKPTDPAYTIGTVLVEENWFEGSVDAVNLVRASGNTLPGVSVLNNRFIRRTNGTMYMSRPPAPYFAGTISGNVIDDDGSPVPISQGAVGT